MLSHTVINDDTSKTIQLFDVANATDHVDLIDSYNTSGVRISELVHYRDGRSSLQNYANNLPTSLVYTDSANNQTWSTIVYAGYVAATAMWSTMTINNDNGSKSIETFDTTGTDFWKDYTFNYDANGKRLSETVDYRDGRTYASTFVNDVLSTQTYFDTANTNPWTSIAYVG